MSLLNRTNSKPYSYEEAEERQQARFDRIALVAINAALAIIIVIAYMYLTSRP